MRGAKFWLAVLTAAVVVVACGATPQAVTPVAAPTVAPSPTAVAPAPAAPTTPGAQGGDAVVDLAIRDLSKRLGIDPAQIAVKSAQSVDWPDTSLGCPQPGEMYAQVITPGRKVVLTAGGKDYTYHTSKSRAVLCSPLR